MRPQGGLRIRAKHRLTCGFGLTHKPKAEMHGQPWIHIQSRGEVGGSSSGRIFTGPGPTRNESRLAAATNPAMLTQLVEAIETAAFYLCIFYASPRMNPFGTEARDELGVRFGRQNAQLPTLERPRTRFEPRTAFLPHRIAKKRAHRPKGRPAGPSDSGPLIQGRALRDD